MKRWDELRALVAELSFWNLKVLSVYYYCSCPTRRLQCSSRASHLAPGKLQIFQVTSRRRKEKERELAYQKQWDAPGNKEARRIPSYPTT